MRAKPHRTLTPLALAVLRLLHERPMHPYEMHQLVRDRGTDYVIKVRAGSLYHAVERLHRLGLIEPVETGRDGRRPERTVYAITGAGRDEFTTNLDDLVRFPAEEFPVFPAALEMITALDPSSARRLLEQRTLALEAELASGEQTVGTLTKRGIDRVHLIEAEYVVHMHRAELSWVRALIADIDAGDLSWRSPHQTTTPTSSEEHPS
jgi:DNA-binding PadR family transcriptional regulator